MAKGIDIKINELVAFFGTKLFVGKTTDFYGRAFLNRRSGNPIPEVLTANTNEYQDVLLNDSKAATCFFIVNNNRYFDTSYSAKANVSIYFSLNLKTLYPSTTERATEYAYEDIVKIINQYSSFDIVSIAQGWESYDGFALTDFPDNMQPFHLCRFDCTVTYNIINC